MNKFLIIGIFTCMLFYGGYIYGKEPIKKDIQIPPEIAGVTTILEVKPFLENPDWQIRIAAVNKLKQIGSREAKDTLLQILTSYLKKGPPGYLDADYFYLNEVQITAESLYTLYNPKEDSEIYNFFKPIALNKIKDKHIIQNDKLRVIAYKLYLKTELSKKDMTKDAILKHIKNSTKPYKTYYEASGVLSQGAVEYNAKKQLLKEYSTEDNN